MNAISVCPSLHSNQNHPGVQLFLVYLRAETGQAQEQNTGSNMHSQPVRVKRKDKRDKAGGKHGETVRKCKALPAKSLYSDQLNFMFQKEKKPTNPCCSFFFNNIATEFCRKPVQKSAKKKCKGTQGDLKEKENNYFKEQPKTILKLRLNNFSAF